MITSVIKSWILTPFACARGGLHCHRPLQHGVALRSQHPGDEPAQRRFIFGEQDGFFFLRQTGPAPVV